jgi:type II secretory pathway component PulJ
MSRLRAEDGMTLPEVLIAVTIGFVVLAATMGLLESTLRLSGGVMAKTDAMQRGRLAMDRLTQEMRSTSGEITESVVEGTDVAGTIVYTAAPTKQVLFQGASRMTKKVAGVDTPVPFLQYFAYEETGTPPVLRTSQVLAPPLSDAAAARVARIEIAFNARPTGAKDATNATDVTDQVTVRHADPNLTVPDPMCV